MGRRHGGRQKATFHLTDRGIRTEVVMKADVRPGYTEMMDKKVDAVEKILSQT